jgi:anti-sigma B factor antagonist
LQNVKGTAVEIKVRNINQILVMEISGDIDGKTAPQVQERAQSLMQPNAKILLDMTRVGYMSSAGLRMMLITYRQATSQKAQFALVGLSEEIQDTMSLTGFLKFFPRYDTLEAGLSGLK